MAGRIGDARNGTAACFDDLILYSLFGLTLHFVNRLLGFFEDLGFFNLSLGHRLFDDGIDIFFDRCQFGLEFAILRLGIIPTAAPYFLPAIIAVPPGQSTRRISSRPTRFSSETTTSRARLSA